MNDEPGDDCDEITISEDLIDPDIECAETAIWEEYQQKGDKARSKFVKPNGQESEANLSDDPPDWPEF